MIGWIALFALIALTAYGFWRRSGLGKDVAAPFATVLTFALAGYVLSGSPGLAGQPAAPTKLDADITEALIETRKEFQFEQFGTQGNWITISDGLMRTGNTDQAIGALRRGIELYPNNADLWTAMGAVLLRQSNGKMTIPALYAFNHARQLAPTHPGPDFFAGIAKIEEGNLDAGRTIWINLLARAPENAEWKAGLEKRIYILNQVIARGQGPKNQGAQ